MKHFRNDRKFRTSRKTIVLVALCSVAYGAVLTLGCLWLKAPEELPSLLGFGSSPTPTTTPTPTPKILPDDAWVNAEGVSIQAIQPGAVLAEGEPAVVEIAVGNGEKSLISVSLDSQRQATEEELGTLEKNNPQVKGMNVYFSTYTLSKISGAVLADYDVSPLFTTIDTEGTSLQRLNIAGWNVCGNGQLPAAIDTSGDSVTLCFAAASPPSGISPGGSQFAQNGGPYDSSTSGMIKWIK